jgi:hypothetical protein
MKFLKTFGGGSSPANGNQPGRGQRGPQRITTTAPRGPRGGNLGVRTAAGTGRGGNNPNRGIIARVVAGARRIGARIGSMVR